MSTANSGHGEQGRVFTVSMLAGEITVGPFAMESTVDDLQCAIEELTRIPEVQIEALHCDFQLDHDMLLSVLPTDLELAAAAAPLKVVLDVSSIRARAGFVGCDAPTLVFPCVVGRPPVPVGFGAVAVEQVVGLEALEKRDLLTLTWPVERGVVLDWSCLEAIWRHAFVGLGLSETPPLCAVVMTEPALNPKAHREKMAELMFEVFGMNKLYLVVSQVAALFGARNVTGIVVDIGEDRRICAPVYEGYLLPHAVTRCDYGAGAELTDGLLRALQEKGALLTRPEDREMVGLLKESLCYVAVGGASSEMGQAEPRVVDLPGLPAIELADERFLVPELLFDPDRCSRGEPVQRLALHTQVRDTIWNNECDLHSDFCKCIVVTGGPSRLPGLAERLRTELDAMMPSMTRNLKVLAPDDSHLLSWSGASCLGKLRTFERMWVTKADFDEKGPGVVHTKCI